METQPRTEAVRRLTWLALAVFLWGAFILARLVSLQVVQHSDLLQAARRQQERIVPIAAPRGSIFDRSESPLALSVPLESVFVNPQHVPDIAVAADILARVLEIDRGRLYSRMQWALENRRGFMWVKRKIAPAQAERLRSLNLEWIRFETESQRQYPKATLAAHLLGSVDHAEAGNSGLELGLDEELRGVAGRARMLTDVRRTPIDASTASEAQDGTNLTLTIDERIQFAAERDLAAAASASGAHTASAVVMNPQNGEILAMASYPPFDPNMPPIPGETLGSRLNQCISAPFEPGSVFKVITLAAALDATNLRPETIIHCGDGAFSFFGRVIHEAKRGLGSIPMSEVLQRSSNIGAIQIALRVGQPTLYEYVRRFGFGSSAGVGLPAESNGMLRRLERWQKTSIASVAMGHEISTTTLQLARACSVIANGGFLVKPQLILKRQKPGHPPQTVSSEPPVRILKPETAITMRRMMEGVIINPAGTGKRARLDGYSSGGKTGSAQIFDFTTRRYTHTYNASFMGFAPVTNPAIVVVVTLNGTRGGSAGYGGMVAAPIFRTIAQEALRVLDVPKDLPDQEELPKLQNGSEGLEDLSIAELTATPESLLSDSEVAGIYGPQLPAGVVPGPEPSGPEVPDFHGKTMRAVVEEASALGLPVLLDGSGVAREQSPAAGAALSRGERIRVLFAR